jgi:endonuclease/exonuclease/phosphatase family metal-dependent hydrolase
VDKNIIYSAAFSVVVSSTVSVYAETRGSTQFDRWDTNDIRIVSYNLHGDLDPYQTSQDGFSRVMVAINPDIIVFEEVTGNNSEAQEFADWLNHHLPTNGWEVHLGLTAGIRTIVASHLPMSMQEIDTVPESSTRGVTMALIDLPDQLFARDAYILGVHFKCCNYDDEDISRQKSADAIATWMGDVRFAGNNIDLPFGTPMILTGDMNLVGGPQPELTLITGDVIEEADYCPDVKGDWDNSNLLDLVPVDPNTGDDFTWQGSDWYDPSNLDRIMVTDSVLNIGNNFVFNTDTMTSQELKQLGVNASDTLQSVTSDHLPIVMDFQPSIQSNSCEGDVNGDGQIGVSDILEVIGNWAPSGGECCPGCAGDVDGNLTVDVSDILYLVGNWGICQ